MALNEKTQYKTTTVDRTYTVIGQESKQYMDLVVKIVNEQLAGIKHLSPQTDTGQASVLLAINAISDQLERRECALKLEKQVAGLKQKTIRLTELENRVRQTETTEEEVQDVLKKNGQEGVEIHNHAEAQRVLNENRKQQTRNKGASK